MFTKYEELTKYYAITDIEAFYVTSNRTNNWFFQILLLYVPCPNAPVTNGKEIIKQT